MECLFAPWYIQLHGMWADNLGNLEFHVLIIQFLCGSYGLDILEVQPYKVSYSIVRSLFSLYIGVFLLLLLGVRYRGLSPFCSLFDVLDDCFAPCKRRWGVLICTKIFWKVFSKR